MFNAPEFYQNVSLRLSEVLNDVGVSENMVRKRRSFLLKEAMLTTDSRLLGVPGSFYMLGSQCEGTTTIGLQSDCDTLVSSNTISVIQDWAGWSPGKFNLLMIQNDTNPPGYCYLQCIRPDVPLPVTEEHWKHFVKDAQGRVLMKNTVIDDFLEQGYQREGPSIAGLGGPGFMDKDLVLAFPFQSLPQSVQHWLDHEHSRWPTSEMKKYAATSDCFVVGTGSSVSVNRDFQWRISTSLAERCFIFNLNITQIRCYILLKMILKTFINLHGQKQITSYMCKTVLLHCIRSKPSYVWRDSNILNCLTYGLSTLYQCILCGNCPHFIIPGNNLMAGKISAENKQQLLEKMSDLIRHTAGSLLGIQIDDLGQRLLLKLNIIPGEDYNATFSVKNTVISLGNAACQSSNTASQIDSYYKNLMLFLKNQSLETQIHLMIQSIVNIGRYQNEGNVFVKAACRLLSPLYCTTLGSLMASYNIKQNNPVSPRALGWLSAGINSDVSSSRLKFASVFYCTGDMERAALLLRDTEERYNIQVVLPVCQCYKYPVTLALKLGYFTIPLHFNEEALKYITAFCVRFLPSEINCIPKELQYEIFRSTGEELLHREEDDDWMDWAVVDPIPYLYFLQYKTYGYLQRIHDQQQALNNLVSVTVNEQNAVHWETAWNLLGQCIEQENRLNEALQYYRNSLHVRQTNNVARIHICKLLARQIALAKENNL